MAEQIKEILETPESYDSKAIKKLNQEKIKQAICI
jgi:hypothetical protein